MLLFCISVLRLRISLRLANLNNKFSIVSFPQLTMSPKKGYTEMGECF